MRNEYMREYDRDRDRDFRGDNGGGWSSRGLGQRSGMRGQRHSSEELAAPIVKVIEVLAQSPHGWDDAARRAVREASRTVRDIKSIYIKEMQAVVEDGDIVSFRVNAKVSFALDDGMRASRSREWHGD